MDIFLIDFENVQPAGVGKLVPGDCKIKLFLGQTQGKVPVPLLQALQPFGSDVEYVQIAGSGPNAVDFHVAFYIGRLSSQVPDANFIIVSRDTGFDPLVRHLGTLKIRCKRITALPGDQAAAKAGNGIGKIAKPAPTAIAAKPAAKSAAASTPSPAAKKAKAVTITVLPAGGTSPGKAPESDDVAQLIDLAVTRLKALKAAKPRSVKTLRSSLAFWAPKSTNASVLAEVMDQLSKRNIVVVDGSKVTYRLGLPLPSGEA